MGDIYTCDIALQLTGCPRFLKPDIFLQYLQKLDISRQEVSKLYELAKEEDHYYKCVDDSLVRWIEGGKEQPTLTALLKILKDIQCVAVAEALEKIYKKPGEQNKNIVIKGDNFFDAPDPTPPTNYFVGRQEEKEKLIGYLKNTKKGCVTFCEITGIPGIGKSTLCGEFLAPLPANSYISLRCLNKRTVKNSLKRAMNSSLFCNNPYQAISHFFSKTNHEEVVLVLDDIVGYRSYLERKGNEFKNVSALIKSAIEISGRKSIGKKFCNRQAKAAAASELAQREENVKFFQGFLEEIQQRKLPEKKLLVVMTTVNKLVWLEKVKRNKVKLKDLSSEDVDALIEKRFHKFKSSPEAKAYLPRLRKLGRSPLTIEKGGKYFRDKFNTLSEFVDWLDTHSVKDIPESINLSIAGSLKSPNSVLMALIVALNQGDCCIDVLSLIARPMLKSSYENEYKVKFEFSKALVELEMRGIIKQSSSCITMHSSDCDFWMDSLKSLKNHTNFVNIVANVLNEAISDESFMTNPSVKYYLPALVDIVVGHIPRGRFPHLDKYADDEACIPLKERAHYFRECIVATKDPNLRKVFSERLIHAEAYCNISLRNAVLNCLIVRNSSPTFVLSTEHDNPQFGAKFKAFSLVVFFLLIILIAIPFILYANYANLPSNIMWYDYVFTASIPILTFVVPVVQMSQVFSNSDYRDKNCKNLGKKVFFPVIYICMFGSHWFLECLERNFEGWPSCRIFVPVSTIYQVICSVILVTIELCWAIVVHAAIAIVIAHFQFYEMKGHSCCASFVLALCCVEFLHIALSTVVLGLVSWRYLPLHWDLGEIWEIFAMVLVVLIWGAISVLYYKWLHKLYPCTIHCCMEGSQLLEKIKRGRKNIRSIFNSEDRLAEQELLLCGSIQSSTEYESMNLLFNNA